MLDRLLKLIMTLTLLLFLLQAVVGVLARALSAPFSTLVSSAAHASSIMGGMLAAVLTVSFAVGLVVRGAQLIANRDPHAARERASRVHTIRQRVRRPSEGVPPVEGRAEVVSDPDPAIGEEERA